MNWNRPLMLLVFFLLGVGITLALDTYRSPGSKLKSTHPEFGTTPPDAVDALDPASSSHEARLTDLERQSALLADSLAGMDRKMDRVLDTMQGMSSASSNPSGNTDPESPNHVALQGDEVDMAKSRIFSSLSDTSRKLPDILESPDMKALPVAEKEAVLNEIARRLDSGEINKSQFLPGYRQ